MEQPSQQPYSGSSSQITQVPVRIYQTDERIMIVAPMPGLEPQDISVAISGKQVTINGEDRAPGQDERDLLVDEWRIGPYRREISLPEAVDGELANATYGNGVLVLSLPKAKNGQPSRSVNFQLQPVDSTRGERVGHTGHEVRPASTEEHAKKHR